MHPSQLEQLVKDHQAELRATRGPGRAPERLMHLTRRGVQKTGVGLVRVGLRLAGPDSLVLASPPRGAGLAKSPF